MRPLIRALLQALVRFFYHTIVLSGGHRIPAEGPVLVVANHPNGLVDPVVLGIALRRPLAFLAKSTFFDISVAKLAMEAFGAIPIYRAVDGESTRNNEKTFALCRELLQRKGWVAIFPEGTTHSEPSLKPIKTGAARIILATLAEGGPEMGLKVLPVGLLYEDKETFRSRVAVSVGEPTDLSRYLADYLREPRDVVDRATAEIEAALHRVTLEAETRELWQGFVAVAAWTSREAAADLAVREARARELAKAWRRLSSTDPDRAAAVLAFTRQFVRMLQAVGIRNPFGLDAAEASRSGATIRSFLPLVLVSPLAAVGVVLGWGPYRLVRPLALAIARDSPELIGTIKLLLGLLIMTVTYVLEATVAGVRLGVPFGLAVLVGGPLTGYAAVWFGERFDLRRQALHAYWLRAWRASIAREIDARRRELADLVEAELGLSSLEPPL